MIQSHINKNKSFITILTLLLPKNVFAMRKLSGIYQNTSLFLRILWQYQQWKSPNKNIITEASNKNKIIQKKSDYIEFCVYNYQTLNKQQKWNLNWYIE